MNAIFDWTPIVDLVTVHVREGIVLTDPQGEVLSYNPAACRLLGLARIDSISAIAETTGIDLPALFPMPGRHDAASGPDHGDAVTVEGQRRLEVRSHPLRLPGEPEPCLLFVLSEPGAPSTPGGAPDLGSELVTQDPRMLQLGEHLTRIAPTDSPILLQGESGTGKTRLARLIHQRSARYGGPFVAINCAAIPENLLESELFGHVKGAFTGAINRRDGRFQAAHGGTLFLDEIAEIPLHLQAKLLSAIEERQVQMVGADVSVRVDIRVLAASNQDITAMVTEGRFRADLYYRLAVFQLRVPALRERRGDIASLIQDQCRILAERGYPAHAPWDEAAQRAMRDYPWPGNVRELANAVEHAVVLAAGGLVGLDHLPAEIRRHHREQMISLRQSRPTPRPANAVPGDPQRQEIRDALATAEGNRAEAARLLGIDRTTLWRRMHRLGLA